MIIKVAELHPKQQLKRAVGRENYHTKMEDKSGCFCSNKCSVVVVPGFRLLIVIKNHVSPVNNGSKCPITTDFSQHAGEISTDAANSSSCFFPRLATSSMEMKCFGTFANSSTLKLYNG